MVTGGLRAVGHRWSADLDNSGTMLVKPMSDNRTLRASTVFFSDNFKRDPGRGNFDGKVVKFSPRWA